MNILEHLRTLSLDRPYHPFLVLTAKGQIWQFNYADCWEETERWARHFRSLCPVPGTLVLLVLKHGWEQYFAFLGAMRAGLIPSFLAYATPKQNADLYWANHRELFDRAAPGAVVTYAENVEPLAAITREARVPVLSLEQLQTLPPSDLPDLAFEPERIAFVQFSSGTTGLRKGVQITHRQLASQIESCASALRLGPSDGIASWLPLYHDMGLIASFLMPAFLGARIVSIDPFEWVARPAMLLEAIAQYKTTLCWMPNFAFVHLARTAPDDAAYDLSSMRAFINCSEPCKSAAFEIFLRRFAEFGVSAPALQTSYGMAEAVFCISQSKIGTAPRSIHVDAERLATSGEVVELAANSAGGQEFLSCGKAIDGVSIRIKRGANNRKAAVAGEIEIRSGFLFGGYYRNEEADLQAFDGEWFNTGDIGFIKDGELYVCGRKKELLIVHGRNYYANDIEQILGCVAGVKRGRAMAFGRFDEVSQSEQAIALVERDPAHQADPLELRRSVKQAVFDALELTLHAVEVVEPNTLIKTTSGKLSREENRKRYLQPRPERQLVDA